MPGHMVRPGLALAALCLLAACAGGGGQERGTALHHLGGPADGVMLPLEGGGATLPAANPAAGSTDDPPATAPGTASSPAAPGGGTPPAGHRLATAPPAHPAPATAAGPFAPPPEPAIQEVLVTPLDVSGYWKITARSTFGLGDSAFYKRYENDTHICRFEQRRTRLLAYCPLLDSVGEGELDGRHLSLSWSLAGGVAFHVDAEVEGDVGGPLSFTGKAAGRLVGFLPVTAEVPARGARFQPPTEAAPPSLAALRQALQDWDSGQLTAGLYTPNLLPRLTKLLARPGRAAGRGALQDLRYVGSIDRALNKKDAPDARVSHDVYEARYAAGVWLCVVHVGDDGKISDFAC
ncbi:hypothetical protein [Nitrospirillum iridis]|uniref:Uncharacterized protein n=1 Tax=Nitrospirillum iridis TaxID=765888 RepID=A0A7X0AT44_9PROT|nr:hypothetical protein [Nitrospirillum iridis]MBB6249622.1 hypothetical protein [Nitrospirillum iridis]